MKVSQMALAAAVSGRFHYALHLPKAPAEYPAGYPGPQGYSMQGNPGMQGGYPGMPQGGSHDDRAAIRPRQATCRPKGGRSSARAALRPQGPAAGRPDADGAAASATAASAAPGACYQQLLRRRSYSLRLFRCRAVLRSPHDGVVSNRSSKARSSAAIWRQPPHPEFKYEPGVKATVGYMFPQAFALEGTFMGKTIGTAVRRFTGRSV